MPGFQRTFDEWVRTQPKDRDPWRPDLEGLEVKSIAGRAGDLVIWHRLLAHGNGHNRWDRPRLAQYITMSPEPEDGGDACEQRVESWRQRRPMSNWPGDARDWEHVYQQPAKLTELGRKLLGVDSWY